MTLLDELLEHLVRGDPHTLAELAQEMEVGEALVEQMLRDLERADYVRSVETACDIHCADCPRAGACGVVFGGRLWMVTAKGFAAVAAAQTAARRGG